MVGWSVGIYTDHHFYGRYDSYSHKTQTILDAIDVSDNVFFNKSHAWNDRKCAAAHI